MYSDNVCTQRFSERCWLRALGWVVCEFLSCSIWCHSDTATRQKRFYGVYPFLVAQGNLSQLRILFSNAVSSSNERVFSFSIHFSIIQPPSIDPCQFSVSVYGEAAVIPLISPLRSPAHDFIFRRHIYVSDRIWRIAILNRNESCGRWRFTNVLRYFWA